MYLIEPRLNKLAQPLKSEGVHGQKAPRQMGKMGPMNTGHMSRNLGRHK